ncbi:MAG: DUF4176 domain-containing protein [Bacillota bacterium]
MKELLPIGSVVLLKQGKKRLMVYGRLQLQIGTEKVWDYVGCYYPEGNIDPNSAFLFDHEQIERIFFIGFQDPEEFEFKKYLEEKVRERETEK